MQLGSLNCSKPDKVKSKGFFAHDQSSILTSLPIFLNGLYIAVKHIFKSLLIALQSPTFLAPEIGLTEDNFSMDEMGEIVLE